MLLTQKKIEAAKPAGAKSRLRDMPGLYVEIREGVRGITRTFIWRGTIAGRVTEIAIGQYPWTTLERARDAAIDFKRIARQGGDPRIQHRADKMESRAAPSLAECVKAAFEVKAESAKRPAVLESRRKFLERNAAPIIRRPVDTILPADIVDTLKPVWGRPSAKQMRADLRGAFDWAIAAGHLSAGANPAGDAVAAMLPRNGAKVEHRAAVHYGELPGILRAVESCKASLAGRLAWMFMAYTAVRAQEALGARWDEIEGGIWTIAASRMKGARAHSVPLCGAALAILERAKRELPQGAYVFPSSQTGKPITRAHFTAVRKAAGIADRMTNHGTRTCFRTWAAEQTDYSPDVVEQCLAHVVGGMVERAYSRGQLLEKRRAVHEAYCGFLTKL